MMTKKNFESAAELVREQRNMNVRTNADSLLHPANYAAQLLEDKFVEFFRRDNSRFDEDRFRAACRATVKKK